MSIPPLSRQAGRATSSAIRDILVHARRSDVISLAGGVPAATTFPLGILAEAVDRALGDGVGALQYGLTVGEPATRQAVAPWTGVDPAPDVDEIVITAGSQQGLELVARAFLDPGDTVVVAAADYLGALQVFRAHQARLHAIPIDESGLDVERLSAAIRTGIRPKLVYIVPNHHNPTGATLAPARAGRLSALAERYGFLVVDDDPYRALGDDLPIVVGAGSPNVVRLRSTSKVLAPGLRCGWLVASAEIAATVGTMKQAVDLHTSTLTQAVAAHSLSHAEFPRHLEAIRRYYRDQRAALVAAVRTQLPMVAFDEPTGGMFLWVTGAGIDTARLLPAAVEAGVAYVPGAVFDPDGAPSGCMRLSYATASAEEFERGCAILAELLAGRAARGDMVGGRRGRVVANAEGAADARSR